MLRGTADFKVVAAKLRDGEGDIICIVLYYSCTALYCFYCIAVTFLVLCCSCFRAVSQFLVNDSTLS